MRKRNSFYFPFPSLLSSVLRWKFTLNLFFFFKSGRPNFHLAQPVKPWCLWQKCLGESCNHEKNRWITQHNDSFCINWRVSSNIAAFSWPERKVSVVAFCMLPLIAELWSAHRVDHRTFWLISRLIVILFQTLVASHHFCLGPGFWGSVCMFSLT